MEERSASRQIDDIVKNAVGWKGETLSQLRAIILEADSGIVEEVKWKKPSQPEGVPVWSHNGLVCLANILKNSVRLTFSKGAKITDPKKIFNTRLDSKTVRGIDYFEGETIDKSALKELVIRAVEASKD